VQHASAQPQARVLVEVSDVGAVAASCLAGVAARGAGVPGLVARTNALMILPAIPSASFSSSPVPASSATASSRV
jgi:hypothetical protein